MRNKRKRCENCDTTFEYSRKTSKYCSSKCRVSAYYKANPEKRKRKKVNANYK